MHVSVIETFIHLPSPEEPMTLDSYETRAALPEAKAAGPIDDALDAFGRAFEAFKETNDARLARIEGRLSADAVTEEKLARIDAALDQAKSRLDRIQIDRARPPLEAPGRAGRAEGETEHKAAFDLYVRSGESAGLKALERKALSAGSGPDGGYLAPPEIERDVLRRLAEISPIRAIASVKLVSSGQYKRAVSIEGPDSGWVAETAPRPQTDAPMLSELTFPAMELYAMPAATQTLLDDAIVDIEAWLAEEVETAFAEQEGIAFVTGNGVGRPRGFLAYQTVENEDWQPGQLGFIGTGASGGFPASDPSDRLFDLVYTLKAGYQQNSSFVMNRRVQSAIRKFKDADGNYLWAPPLAADRPRR